MCWPKPKRWVTLKQTRLSMWKDRCAHKPTILASIAFGIPLQFDKAYTEGITSIEPQDVNYAESLGYRIKHLGLAQDGQQGVEMRVHPTLVPERRLLANVNGVMNAVLVKGDAVGPTLFYGGEQARNRPHLRWWLIWLMWFVH